MKLFFCLFLVQVLMLERCYTLICYTCSNCTDTNCACDTTATSDDSATYCRIARDQYLDINRVTFTFGSARRNETAPDYVKDPYFILIRESTTFDDDTMQWITYDDLVEYGCQWNYCNQPSLALKLRDSFSLKLDANFLTTNIYGEADNLYEDCNQCPDTPVCGNSSFIDFEQCEPEDCTGTSCVLVERYPVAGSFDQLCYQSFCATAPLSQPVKVEVHAILYLATAFYEIWELDVSCRSSSCGDLGLFQRIRSDLDEDLNILEFLKNATTSTPSATTSTPSATTSTPSATISITETTAVTTNDSSINNLRLMLVILICLRYIFF